MKFIFKLYHKFYPSIPLQKTRLEKALFCRVHKKTSELKTKIKDIETINNFMMGREIKMTELKKEIEKLKQEQIHYKKSDTQANTKE